ncbi:hypothetical protein E2320_022807 [Naja naja]|nr:hypothetical protein E2320_022807 [Naja naja]
MKLAGDLGIPLEKASYIMVGLGVSSMISSLLFGKICDIENIDRLYINQASILSVGVVYFIIPHCTTFGSCSHLFPLGFLMQETMFSYLSLHLI